MREWRKWHSGIVGSDKVRAVSFEAKWLFALLCAAQDDEGKYPWSPAKVQTLTVTCGWMSPKQADKALAQLVEVGLVERRDGFAWIVDGKEKNGKPHNARTPFYYDAKPEPGDTPPPAPTEPRGRRDAASAEPEHRNGAAEAQPKLSPDAAERAHDSPLRAQSRADDAPDSLARAYRVRVEKSRGELSPRTPLTGGQGAGQDALRRAWPFLVAWAAAVGRKPRDATARDRAAACDLADQERDPDQIAEVVTWMLRSPYHGDPARLRSIEGHWAKYLTERDAGACRCGTNGLSAVRPARPTPLFRAVGGTA